MFVASASSQAPAYWAADRPSRFSRASTSRCPLGANKHSIYCMAGCHKQTATSKPAKTNVCATTSVLLDRYGSRTLARRPLGHAR